MIGDRYLTDVVYGNRHGLLTIRPAPLAVKGEPQVVQLVSSLLISLCHSAAPSFSWRSILCPKEALPCVPLCALSPSRCVPQVRKIEDKLVRRWTRQGLKVSCCVTDSLCGMQSPAVTLYWCRLQAPAHSFASDDKLQAFQKEPSPWQ